MSTVSFAAGHAFGVQPMISVPNPPGPGPGGPGQCGPHVVFSQQTHSPWDDIGRSHTDSTTTQETSEPQWQPGMTPPNLGSKTTTTTTRTIDGTSIETKETLEVGEPFDHYSCATTIRVGPNDNVTVTKNCDGSADVTVNGVTHHLTPKQAENIQIIR